jgi:Protein of unknown function DUF58
MHHALATEMISFFSGHTDTIFDMDELRDIRPYTIGDTPHSINWKKSASYGQTMTNSYEPDTHIRGQIICVRSANRSRGRNHTIQHGIDLLIETIQHSIAHDAASRIEVIITDHPPTDAQLRRTKTMVISDFFWKHTDLKRCITHCQKGLSHGLIVPILTPLGQESHLLRMKYPQYFWSLAV